MYMNHAWAQYSDLLVRLGNVYNLNWSVAMLGEKLKADIETELRKSIKFIAQSNGMIPIQVLSDCFTYWALWTLHKHSPSMSDREIVVWGSASLAAQQQWKRREEMIRYLARGLNVKFSCKCGAFFEAEP